MKNKSLLVRLFLPLFVMIFCFFGAMHLLIQQNYRQNANDPQIQIAYDLQNSLDNGFDPKNLNYPRIDLSKSLSTFIIIYDNNLKVIYSSAILNGNTPNLPTSVLYSVDQNNEDRITWQPESGVRIATEIIKYKNGYILVGRSLKLIEERENQLTLDILVGFIGTAILTGASLLLV